MLTASFGRQAAQTVAKAHGHAFQSRLTAINQQGPNLAYRFEFAWNRIDLGEAGFFAHVWSRSRWQSVTDPSRQHGGQGGNRHIASLLVARGAAWARPLTVIPFPPSTRGSPYVGNFNCVPIEYDGWVFMVDAGREAEAMRLVRWLWSRIGSTSRDVEQLAVWDAELRLLWRSRISKEPDIDAIVRLIENYGSAFTPAANPA